MPRPRLALLLACTLVPLWSMPAHAVSDVWVPLGSLQGSGEISPKVGHAAMVEGVVTGSFSEGLGGFFLQDQGDGNYFAPTILDEVPLDASVFNNEPFGPVAAVRGFDTIEEALKEANRLPYGLATRVRQLTA